MTIFLF